MNRNQLYAEVKRQAQELGYDLAPIRSLYRTSTAQLWRNRINSYAKNMRNRNNNYNRALRVSREIREPLQLSPITRGTDNEQWVRELRRLRMRARRAPARIQAIQAQRQAVVPILRAVQQRPARQRQQERNRLFQQGIVNARTTKRAKIKQRKSLKTVMAQLNNNMEEKRNIKMFDRLLNQNEFNRIIYIVLNENKTLTATQTNTFWNKAMARGRLVMNITKSNGENQTLALNNTTKDWFIDLIRYGTTYETVESYGSDIWANYRFEDITSVVISKYTKPERVIKNKNGKFFPYINKTNMDLIKYQIFNQKQAYDNKITTEREHCLIHTLLECGINKAKTNNVKMAYLKGCNISKKDLSKIASIINRDIILHYMNSTEDCTRIYTKKYKAGNTTDGPEIDIAIYENHYFKFEETIYSKFSINNYNLVKDQKNFKDITKKRGKKGFDRTKNKFKISSLLMVDKLFNSGYFVKLDLVKFEETSTHVDLKTHIYLGNMDNEQQLYDDNEFEGIDIPDIDVPYREQLDKEHEEFMAEMDNMTCDCGGTCEFCNNDYPIELLEFQDDEQKGWVKALNKQHEKQMETTEFLYKRQTVNQRQTEKQEIIKPLLYYADCESYVKDEDKEHTLQLLGVVGAKNDMVDILNICDPAFKHEKICREQMVVFQW
jgi:hypothetical protein